MYTNMLQLGHFRGQKAAGAFVVRPGVFGWSPTLDIDQQCLGTAHFSGQHHSSLLAQFYVS